VAKALLTEVTSQHTGTKAYQDKLKAMERELESNTEQEQIQIKLNEKDGTGEWDDNIDEEDLKMPGRDLKEKGIHVNDGSKKVPSGTGHKGAKSAKKRPAAILSSPVDPIANLVLEVKEALQDMAALMEDMRKAKESQGTKGHQQWENGSKESEESEEDRKPKSQAKKHLDQEWGATRKGRKSHHSEEEESSEEENPRRPQKERNQNSVPRISGTMRWLVGEVQESIRNGDKPRNKSTVSQDLSTKEECPSIRGEIP
jgi:hypothetical protein